MGKHMKKVSWLVVVLLVVIVAIWGCNLFDRDRDISPTGPGNAESFINGFVGGGVPGALYWVYNEVTRWGVALSKGCWRIEYYSKDKSGPFWAVTNIGGDLELANIGMIPANPGPADSAWVAKITGTCPVKVGEVVLLGTGTDFPSLSNVQVISQRSGHDGPGTGKQVIDKTKPTVGDAKAPETGGSPTNSMLNYQSVTVKLALLD